MPLRCSLSDPLRPEHHHRDDLRHWRRSAFLPFWGDYPDRQFPCLGAGELLLHGFEIDSDGNCVYPHPVPLCTDPDDNTKRYFTVEELATYAEI